MNVVKDILEETDTELLLHRAQEIEFARIGIR